MVNISKMGFKDNREDGLASIFITMIMMMVIGLIVLGFTSIAQRESRQSIDRQLNTEAFYAAESGINDAVKAINAGDYPNGKASCGPDAYLNQSVYGSSASTSITCLIIATQVPEMVFNYVSTDKPTVFLAQTTASSQTLTLTWTNYGTSGYPNWSCPSFGTFPVDTSSGWNTNNCPPPLRIDLVPVNAINNMSLIKNSSASAVLYPTTTNVFSPPIVNWNYPPNNNAAKQIQIVDSTCSTWGNSCSANIVFPNGVPNNLQSPYGYYLRVVSIYGPVALNVFPNSGNNFINGEYQIDSTGKANDELKRVSLFAQPQNLGGNNVPNYALQSTNSICKRYLTGPGANLTFFQSVPGVDNSYCTF